jgi:predicted nuclease of predicted toxin-antitoxin system
MRLLADEHVPPAIVSALRGEGHNIAVVGDDIELGSEDTVLLEYARDTDRIILSEDTDFRGANPELTVEQHPGILACDTTASPGEIAAATRRIETFADDLTGTVLYVPGNWL